jgi:hypothetical protein
MTQRGYVLWPATDWMPDTVTFTRRNAGTIETGRGHTP